MWSLGSQQRPCPRNPTVRCIFEEIASKWMASTRRYQISRSVFSNILNTAIVVRNRGGNSGSHLRGAGLRPTIIDKTTSLARLKFFKYTAEASIFLQERDWGGSSPPCCPYLPQLLGKKWGIGGSCLSKS